VSVIKLELEIANKPLFCSIIVLLASSRGIEADYNNLYINVSTCGRVMGMTIGAKLLENPNSLPKSQVINLSDDMFVVYWCVCTSILF
jgi:hypothetical protein